MRCNRYMMLGVALVMVTTGMSQPYPTKLLSNEQQIESLIQQMTLEEKVRVWQAINKPYQVSLFYKAGPVFLSSEVVIDTPRVVDATFGIHVQGEDS